jgi:glyoxylase-like metal-dependent hydrolase (beta-lactamase superfamily II)
MGLMVKVAPLAPGVDWFDLNFIGEPGIIATLLLHGPGGVVIVDPGPTTCLPTLEAALAQRGFGFRDVQAVLLTHIHLDHAASAGVLLDLAPHATLYVHERGAPHMVDPSKLIASARRLYLDDMDRLWGEMRPVPAARLHAFSASDTLRLVGHTIRVAWTPGHAWHHVSYLLEDSGIACVGDTAGICRPDGRVIVPPTPPPDIDLDAWRASSDTILGWNPSQLFLTHFGPQSAPRVHMQAFWIQMDNWSHKVRSSLTWDVPSDQHRIDRFLELVTEELGRVATPAEAASYARAGRFDFSWTGLARYWRKKEG